MKTLLFVDACMRGHEQSRTYGLCRHFIDEYLKTHPVSYTHLTLPTIA